MEQSASMFDEFLKENDKNSVEASKMSVCVYMCVQFVDFQSHYCGKPTLCYLLICRAESATKAKLEKVAEIKRLNAQIMAIKRYTWTHQFSCFMLISYCFVQCTSEISRNDDQLNELKTYRTFLNDISPEVHSACVYAYTHTQVYIHTYIIMQLIMLRYDL